MTFTAYEPTLEWEGGDDYDTLAYAHAWVESPRHANRRYRIYRHNDRKVDLTVEIDAWEEQPWEQTVTVGSLSAAFRRAEQDWEQLSDDEYPVVSRTQPALTLTWNEGIARSVRHADEGRFYVIEKYENGYRACLCLDRHDLEADWYGPWPYGGALPAAKLQAEVFEGMELSTRTYHHGEDEGWDEPWTETHYILVNPEERASA